VIAAPQRGLDAGGQRPSGPQRSEASFDRQSHGEGEASRLTGCVNAIGGNCRISRYQTGG